MGESHAQGEYINLIDSYVLQVAGRYNAKREDLTSF